MNPIVEYIIWGIFIFGILCIFAKFIFRKITESSQPEERDENEGRERNGFLVNNRDFGEVNVNVSQEESNKMNDSLNILKNNQRVISYDRNHDGSCSVYSLKRIEDFYVILFPIFSYDWSNEWNKFCSSDSFKNNDFNKFYCSILSHCIESPDFGSKEILDRLNVKSSIDAIGSFFIPREIMEMFIVVAFGSGVCLPKSIYKEVMDFMGKMSQ